LPSFIHAIHAYEYKAARAIVNNLKNLYKTSQDEEMETEESEGVKTAREEWNDEAQFSCLSVGE
jgi:KaiC/GvpD/RAD55 family RecA-like ATPase